MNKQDPNLRERALFLFSPKRANKVYRDRLLREGQNDSDGKSRMAATGYGNHGASTTLNSMVGWLAAALRTTSTFTARFYASAHAICTPEAALPGAARRR